MKNISVLDSEAVEWVVEHFREDWPPTSGHSSEDRQQAIQVVRNCCYWLNTSDVDEIGRLIVSHWAPNCRPLWSESTLAQIIQEGCSEKAANNNDGEQVGGWRYKLRKRAALAEARRNNAALNISIANKLNVSTRYARMIRAEGTTIVAHAKVVAEILGADPEEYLRRRKTSERRSKLVKWLMDAFLDKGTFRDFVQEADDGRRSKNPIAADLYFQEGDDLIALSRIDTLEGLIHHVRCSGFGFRDTKVFSLWNEYRIWRIELAASVAKYSIINGD